MSGAGSAGWRDAEREFEDAVIGESTLPELFEDSVERNGRRRAQLYKGVYDRSLAGTAIDRAPRGEYAAITYEEMGAIVRRLAAGFRELGVEAGDRVAIYGDTRMEWALADFALLSAGAVVTTVYTEASTTGVRHLLDDPDAVGVVVENADLLETVREVEGDLDLEFAVLMDDHESDRADTWTLADVYERGAEAYDESTYREWLAERDPADLASIIYTSGTTGEPKGVKLTHRNFRANVNQVYRRLGPRPDKDDDLATLSADTTSIAFLPLAHVFERMAGHFLMFGVGATVGYTESPDTLADDITKIRPNTGASVPRVYERIFDSMREQAGESPVKERIFSWAVDVAREWCRTEDPGPLLRARHAVADRLVYATLRENLGGEVEFMVSGGGSLSKDLCETFVGMGVPVIEGYGLTETAPVVSVNPPEDVRPGTLGPSVPDVDVRIDSSVIAEADFEARAGGDLGELLVRGPNVTDGYWNRPEETEHAFTDADAGAVDLESDGGAAAASGAGSDARWFRTGDIVELTDDGYLIYRDRLKELIVLSTGKNVAPQPIEDAFATSDRVSQVMVVGDGRKFVGALIVPNFEALRRWADREGIDLPDDEGALCRDERVREWVEEAVEAVNRDLDRVEQVKDFELVSREWTAENDLLTPSMKKKRRKITAEFEEKVASIYED